MASAAGGMDIEEVAHEHAGEDPHARPPSRGGPRGLPGAQARLRPRAQRAQQQASSRDILRKLVKLFRECDASLVEINPLIVTKDGE